jgi:hypothetical protein
MVSTSVNGQHVRAVRDCTVPAKTDNSLADLLQTLAVNQTLRLIHQPVFICYLVLCQLINQLMR